MPAGSSARLYRSNPISVASIPSTLVFSTFDRIPGYRMALYEDVTIGSAKAIFDDAGFILTYAPFFDGTFRAELRDGNDFSVVETGICYGLRTYYTAYPNRWAFCGRRHSNTLVPGELP